MKKILLVEVEINDVEKKYPNFQFNYENKEDFLANNIVPHFNRYNDEQEYDAGYEHFVANELLDTMETFAKVGHKVYFQMKTGYMGKESYFHSGVITEVDMANELVKISNITKTGKKSTVTRKFDEIITVYDFLEQV